jgi:hypothetical protein
VEKVPLELDLGLAWQRVRRYTTFVDQKDDHRLLDVNTDGWLEGLNARLAAEYQVGECQICKVPKAGGDFRPGAVLSTDDAVAYTALVGRYYPEIRAAFGELASNQVDIANRLQPDPRALNWITNDVSTWGEFREKSLDSLDGCQFVVISDIAGFYENIDIVRLISELREIGFAPPDLVVLQRWLSRWAEPRGKGIPQGCEASHLLAKVYLNVLDQQLINDGIRHLRYVDDIRIFARSNRDAKFGLARLADYVRRRGLNLQTAKTKIVTVDKGRTVIESIAPLIRAIQKQLDEELSELLDDDDNPYATIENLEHYAAERPDNPSLRVLETAFREHFEAGDSQTFNKSLLHFLLNRLGRTKSRIAVSYCIHLLESHPEETEIALRYLSLVVPEADEVVRVVDVAASEDTIYDYQLYQIAKWVRDIGCVPDKMLAQVRIWLGRNIQWWLRDVCYHLLGEYGNAGDREQLVTRLVETNDYREKAILTIAIRGLERVRRNSIYGRIQNDHFLVRQAVQIARQDQLGER